MAVRDRRRVCAGAHYRPHLNPDPSHSPNPKPNPNHNAYPRPKLLTSYPNPNPNPNITLTLTLTLSRRPLPATHGGTGGYGGYRARGEETGMLPAGSRDPPGGPTGARRHPGTGGGLGERGGRPKSLSGAAS